MIDLAVIGCIVRLLQPTVHHTDIHICGYMYLTIYKLLTTDAQENIEEVAKRLLESFTFVKREYRETNCFFIRSNILIDSIRFWMNYSFREEWRNPLSIYTSSVFYLDTSFLRSALEALDD